MLGVSLLSHEVRLLDVLAIRIGCCHTKLREFVVGAKLLVVAIAVGIVQRGRGRPPFADVPRGGEGVVVLPEVIGDLVPVGTVNHRVALRDIVAIGIPDEVTVSIISQILIERVVLAQPHVPQILVGLDACLDAIGAVHQTHIVVACCDTVPGLTRTLEVSDVLIAEHEIVGCQPGESSVVGAAAP